MKSGYRSRVEHSRRSKHFRCIELIKLDIAIECYDTRMHNTYTTLHMHPGRWQHLEVVTWQPANPDILTILTIEINSFSFQTRMKTFKSAKQLVHFKEKDTLNDLLGEMK